ncbi:hypothetical protein AAFF_G00006160 [Aldrovandia affinis]|uniref:Uncharacterized protein n=1 Tax=Aldrovandia affinis TaxID=143900 RepID=A0AAD7TDW5_9TELE|nr:hypothetical protein AAFF_G00006160 [Aldrovandia affinis]
MNIRRWSDLEAKGSMNELRGEGSSVTSLGELCLSSREQISDHGNEGLRWYLTRICCLAEHCWGVLSKASTLAILSVMQEDLAHSLSPPSHSREGKHSGATALT